MSLQVRAFLFDLDGVIADTTEYHYRSWKRLAEEEGLPFTRADNEALRGLSRRASLNQLLREQPVDEATAQAWMARKNAYFSAYLEQMTSTDLLPGVVQLIDEARAYGLKTAVASSSQNAKRVLERLGVLDRFDVVGDAFCVANTKPAPDIFLWVLERLSVSPNEAVVFEDAEVGVAAARSAGCWVVGVGNADLSGAHVLLPTLAAARVEAILAALAASSVHLS
ncbi:MAG: beta-phosphoglucomutase [Aggregatilineales bacterium]